MAHDDSVGVNQALRRELLTLVEEDHAFVSAPDHDPNSDEVQRQVGSGDGWWRSSTPTAGRASAWSATTVRRRPGCWPCIPCPTPKVLRRCLTLLRAAAEAGEAEPAQVAHLVDRVSLVERNVQVYGTTICRQEDGSFAPPLLEDPEHVDERRRAVGLPSLDQDIRRIEAFYRRKD